MLMLTWHPHSGSSLPWERSSCRGGAKFDHHRDLFQFEACGSVPSSEVPLLTMASKSSRRERSLRYMGWK
jgi:hypothetical protein